VIEIIPNWHPLFVHFTVGLLSTAVIFYFATLLLSNRHPWKQQWLTMANWCLWTGCLFAIATATAGWFAYNSVAHDAASHAEMTLHRNWALPTVAIFLLMGLWAIILARKRRRPGFLFLTFSLIAAGMLMVTGWLGAEAVYRYGLGVKSLPTVEEGGDGYNHSHNHSHNSMHDETSDDKHNHPTTETEQMMSLEDHPLHDHESEATPPKNDPENIVVEHSHKTMPEVTTDVPVQQSPSDQHLHGSNTPSPLTKPLEQNNNTTEKNTMHSDHHTHNHNEESSAHHHH